jgi:hypothetical protein
VEIEYAGNRRGGGIEKSRTENWFEYRFRVPLSSSHYYVGALRKRTVFPYDGLFWLDATSAELKRLVVRTTELPERTGACEATTTIDFRSVALGRHEFTIPSESRLQFVMRNGDESENATTLSNCHEYSSESVVRFDEAAEGKAGVEKDATRGPDPLPPGLMLMLGLETEIDTDTAAAGDPVIARVVRDVLERNGHDYRTARILVRAGALARGRVIKLEHQITGRSYFLIALRFETLESNGTVMPLHVKLPRKLTGATGWPVQSRTVFPDTGTFVFRSRAPKYVLPKGHESTWVTFKPAR